MKDGATLPTSTAAELPATGGGLVGVAIRQPVFTTMIMVGLVVLGLFGLRRLAIDQFPDVSIPIVTIQTTYPGASPEVIEREVSKRIEEAVNPTRGVDELTSTSLEGVSLITVAFELGTDIDAATADIRSKIEQIRRNLPDAIDQPLVQQFDPAQQPILSLALSSDAWSATRLTELADGDLRRALEGVNGVGRVQITGASAREVHILLRPEQMEALDISVQEVQQALSSQNLEIPAGRIEQGNREMLVRVLGRITDPAQFGNIIVASRNGQTVRLRQVAEVRDASEEARSIALIDGEPAVGIDLLKVSGANTVAVAEGIKEVIAEVRQTLPPEVALRTVRDNSVSIEESVAGVEHELVLGALLTVLIVFLFLNNGRATLITSLTLPVSVVSTFILLDALGFTLNTLTLMALSLSIGILIDDAIVVVENIVRHREEGASPMAAAYGGTSEIFLAVMATTFSIVAVFVPVAFMGGIIGRFFYQFGITVAWAVLVSLFVSFTLTPMLSARWLRDDHGSEQTLRWWSISRPIGAFNRWFDRMAGHYHGMVTWALAHRPTILVAAALSMVGALALFPLVGGSFMPEQDAGEFSVTFETPTGSSLSYTTGKAHEVERVLRGIDGVIYTFATVGAGQTGTVNRGEVFVKMTKRGERRITQQDAMSEARRLLANRVGIEASVLVGGGMGGTVKPIQIALKGPESGVLQALSDSVVSRVKQVPTAIEVSSSLGDPRPEIRLVVDLDRANDLGLSAAQIANTVQPLLTGATATTWEDPTGEERDVVVRLPEEDRTTPERIARLPLVTSQRGTDGRAVTVPLGAVATLEQGTAPSQIDRKDLSRVATVAVNLAPGHALSDVSADVEAALADLPLPDGYSFSLAGDTKELAETTGYVLESLMLAIILIYLILASQFGSFLQPIAIMLSLPLSLVGVMLALLFTGDTLNIMSMIGIIMLMGLVTKNAILLVDYANALRARGVGIFEAVAQAGSVRLRPIMMTTLAMIAGMIPIALGTGDGGEFRAPMARAVIGGLITSTMLTLIVVPVVYSFFEQWSTRFGGRGATQPEGQVRA